jgi:hypothetical protein
VAAAVVVTRTAAKVRSERTGAPGRAERVRHLPEQPESSRSPSQQVAAAPIRAQAGWEIVEVIVVGSFSFNFNLTPSPIPVARNVPTAYFAAARNGVARDCIAKGPMIFLNAEDTASEGGIVQSPAHWQAFTQFSDQLSAQGWELIDSWGKFWYSARFQRPISFK